jgi:hypothetical protein
MVWWRLDVDKLLEMVDGERSGAVQEKQLISIIKKINCNVNNNDNKSSKNSSKREEVTYVRTYVPSLAETMAPLREVKSLSY